MSGHGNSAPIHLAGEDLVAKEPVAENAAVAVRTVQALSASDIDEISEQGMHGVVLLANVIEVRAVLIDLVLAHHALQHQERVEVFVLPAGCVVEDTDGGVHHLVVADHEQARVEHSLFQVVHLEVRSTRHRAEVLLNEIDQLLMIHCACSHHYNVLAEIVPRMEVCDHFAIDLANVVDVAENGLTHHVVAEHIEVDILHQSLLRVLIRRFKLLPNRVFLDLEVIVVVNAVAEHVT